jgi:hypothetical protein
VKMSKHGLDLARGASEKERAVQGVVMGLFNLTTLLLFQGKLLTARSESKKAVKLAGKSQGASLVGFAVTFDANVRAQLGECVDGDTVRICREWKGDDLNPEFQFVSYLQRFLACDLLLYNNLYDDVIEWLKTTGLSDTPHSDCGLDQLNLGYALFLRSQLKQERVPPKVKGLLIKAIENLTRAHNTHHIPRARLALSDFLRQRNDLVGARKEVDEAMTYAANGMDLHMADCHLAYAKLNLADGEIDKSQKSLDEAREIIQRIGYGRRKKELAELEKQIGGFI